MAFNAIPLWKEAPFLRLIIPFLCGIILQWYTDLPVTVYWLAIPVCTAVLFIYHYFRSFSQFSYYGVAGIAIHLLLLCTGAMVTYYEDMRHQTGWIGHFDQSKTFCIVTLEEPLSKKGATLKAAASVDYIYRQGRYIHATGKLVVYFGNDSSCKTMSYNSRIAFGKPLQKIKNMGNPGGFDYKQYCAFRNIYHQVYLQPGEYIRVPAKAGGSFTRSLFYLREKIVGILHKYIREKESGLAEALLIGYKDDLDKDLVQSYTNTGVVHIIAISGMHLGLIYWMLTQLFLCIKRLPFRWLSPVLIIASLWTFSFITGGSPSVMRSAVMFTLIICGQYAGKKASVYNSLAASALLLLCYDPFWLWDASFQLSYLALMSIVIFMRPVYNWFYVKNKLLDALVSMFATTLAAQVLTMPVSVYLFHQFPVYFLLTNMVAVPLSSLVVVGEIAVCACSCISLPAKGLGIAVSWMIALMNRFIACMEHLPFSMWSQLNISLLQTILLYVTIIMLSIWLLQKKPWLLPLALCPFTCFMLIRTRSFVSAQQQKKMIVYNVPKHQVIDLVSGRYAVFVADSALQLNPALIKANVQPAGTLYRFNHIEVLQSDSCSIQGFCFAGKKILVCNRFVNIKPLEKRVQADIVVISGNPHLQIEDFIQAINCRLVVFDGSNPGWKISRWESACKKAGLNYYAVAEKGAFVFNPD